MRALKWLEYLEADEQDPARVAAGQRAITLELQVDMFKVIAEWLKTSKKTKNPDKDIDGTPAGIDAMAQAIETAMQRMGAAGASHTAKSAEVGDENQESDPDSDLAPNGAIPPVPVAKSGAKPKADDDLFWPPSAAGSGRPVPTPATPTKRPSGAARRRAAREQSEDDELALLLNRARDRALRGDDDETAGA